MSEENPFQTWRKLKGFGPNEAAQQCGVKRVTWWRWETGASRVDVELLEKVSTVTGIPRAELRPDIFVEAAQ